MKFFAISLKNAMVYRWQMIFSIIGSILFIAINILLWRFLYSGNDAMIIYMTQYTIVSNIIAMFYIKGISERIGGKVSTGAFVTDLIRPINLFTMAWQMELAGAFSRFIMKGLPVIVIYLPLLFRNASYHNIPLVLLSILLGHVLYVLIYSLLGFSAYILIEIWPFKRLVDDTIRLLAGSFIPLEILPESLRNIANILPFRFLFSFPMELLFQKNVNVHDLYHNFLILLIWILIFAVLNVVMYKRALNKAVVQGG